MIEMPHLSSIERPNSLFVPVHADGNLRPIDALDGSKIAVDPAAQNVIALEPVATA